MQIAIALFPRFTALDAIGPYQVLSQVPEADVRFVAAAAGPVADDTRLTVSVEHTLAELTRPDVIVVPGGLITRRMARDGDPVIDWIASVHPTTTWTTSVCTGSILLAAAGVLRGLRATSHWGALEQLRRFGAEPTSERVVEQGKVITAAGVSSGIDMALRLAARLAGAEVAQAIQLGIEYDPEPPFDTGDAESASDEVRQRALEALLASQ